MGTKSYDQLDQESREAQTRSENASTVALYAKAFMFLAIGVAALGVAF